MAPSSSFSRRQQPLSRTSAVRHQRVNCACFFSMRIPTIGQIRHANLLPRDRLAMKTGPSDKYTREEERHTWQRQEKGLAEFFVPYARC